MQIFALLIKPDLNTSATQFFQPLKKQKLTDDAVSNKFCHFFLHVVSLLNAFF